MFHLIPRHVGEKRDTKLPLKWQSSMFLQFVRLHGRVLSKRKCVLPTNMAFTITRTTSMVEMCSRLSDRSEVYYCNRDLHIYPLGSLALPCVLQDIPRGAGFQAAALQKRQHALLLLVEKQNLLLCCCSKTQRMFLIALHGTWMGVKPLKQRQWSLCLNLWWNQMSRLESGRRECYPSLMLLLLLFASAFFWPKVATSRDEGGDSL